MQHIFASVIFIVSIALAGQSYANISAISCKDITDAEQRLKCYDQQTEQLAVPITDTVLDERIKQEAANMENSFSLTAHHSSYLLPLTYATDPNSDIFGTTDGSDTKDTELENLEVKFQISFRVPIKNNFLVKNSELWFGYTQLSLWQLYDSDNSAPFRETNYEPEIIWSFLANESFGDLKLTHFSIALSHQSNGRSEPLSRSWNRIVLNTIWAHKKWAFSFRPWYRIPENKDDDDNPDIDDYMGHFDFRAAYKEDDHQFSTVIRSAIDEDNPHSFYELGYSFSINRKFRGYVQFVSGYGETLLDYNHRNKRFSIGIMLNDWF